MSTTRSIKNKGIEGITQAEKALNTANKAAAEVVGERLDRAARVSQEHATDFMTSVRNAIAAGSQQLRNDGYSTAANLFEKAAAPAETAEERVGNIDTSEIANSVQQFIREKPLIAFGGLAVAGFLAAAAMQKARHDLD